MVEVTYTGHARAWSTAAHGGLVFERGETQDVDEDAAEFLTSNYDFEEAPVDDGNDAEPADLPDEFAVLDETVPEVEARIEDGAFDGQLGALENVEAGHKDRAGVYEAIEERQNALEGEDEADESE